MPYFHNNDCNNNNNYTHVYGYIHTNFSQFTDYLHPLLPLVSVFLGWMAWQGLEFISRKKMQQWIGGQQEYDYSGASDKH